MKLRDIMASPVVTVESDDRLSTVRELFVKTRFHHLLVVEGGKLRGSISQRDLAAAISPNIGTMAELPKDQATLNKHAHQIMRRQLLCLAPDDDVHAAIAAFNRNDIACIPIVDSAQQTVGIVSWRDILRRAEECGFNGD